MIDIQSMVLSSMVQYPQTITDVLVVVNEDYFTNANKLVFKAIVEIFEQSSRCSIEALEIKFKDNVQILDNLLSAYPSSDYLDFIPTLEKEYNLRRMREMAAMLMQSADDEEVVGVDEMLALAPSNKKKFLSVKEWVDELKTLPHLPKYQTGVSFLDYALDGGIEVAQLVLLSGEPEAGKTSMGVQILENIAKGFECAFFCFEFTARQYIEGIVKKNNSFSQNENLIVINDGFGLTDVVDNIRYLAKKGVKFFLIDSQMRITTERARSIEEEESAKFSTLAKLAHRLEIIILMIIQNSKSDPDNPMGSKKGGHESSITIRIEHVKPQKDDSQDTEYAPDKRTIIIKKNKQTGKHFKEQVAFDPKTRRFKSAYERKYKASDELPTMGDL